MPRSAHRKTNHLTRAACHAETHRNAARRRVLCFECYRSRVDRPEHVTVLASPFPRVLTDGELEHRRRMLAHLGSGTLRERCETRGTLAGI
jgi:hypothetical protein